MQASGRLKEIYIVTNGFKCGVEARLLIGFSVSHGQPSISCSMAVSAAKTTSRLSMGTDHGAGLVCMNAPR